jgi:hypothetical protein
VPCPCLRQGSTCSTVHARPAHSSRQRPMDRPDDRHARCAQQSLRCMPSGPTSIRCLASVCASIGHGHGPSTAAAAAAAAAAPAPAACCLPSGQQARHTPLLHTPAGIVRHCVANCCSEQSASHQAACCCTIKNSNLEPLHPKPAEHIQPALCGCELSPRGTPQAGPDPNANM